MQIIPALHITALLLLATNGMAATVQYQYPDLTIVARQEPLAEVLKALGKEMRIYITIPTGLNPSVNCDIQQQPVKQALKTLLGEMSYSLEWEEKTDRLVGLNVLAGGEEPPMATVSRTPVQSPSVAAPEASHGGQGAAPPAAHSNTGNDTAIADRDTAMAEHEASMETERAEQEARMAQEREAQEARMQEEVARHDAQQAAELDAFLKSKGVEMPQ